MRRYETFVIIDPDISEDERGPVIARVQELISQMDGFLVFTDDWGEKKLAYGIRKKERGYYVRFDYCGLAPLVNEIERFFRIDDRALKYMTVLLDKEADLEKIKEEKAAAENQSDSDAPPEENQTEPEAAGDEVNAEAESEARADAPSTDDKDSVTENTPLIDQEEA